MLSYMSAGSQPVQYAVYGTPTSAMSMGGVPTLQQPTSVVSEQPKSGNIKPLSGYQETPKWSWLSTGCSVFALLCCSACGFVCGPIFSLLGLVFSLNAYTDHKSSDFPRSKKKIKCAWIFIIMAIVWGILFSVLIGVLGGVLPIAEWIQEAQDKLAAGTNPA